MADSRESRKRIVFTDAGIDDAFALIFLHHFAQQDVDCLVCSGGNVHAEFVANNCAFLKRTFRFGSTIYLGSDPPGMALLDASDVHGPYGLARYRPASCILRPWSALMSELRSEEADLDVVVLGPATDLATLLSDAELSQKMKRIVVMGGAFHPRDGRLGNITEHAEFNVYMDPSAAWKIMTSARPSVWIPLDATEEHLYTEQELLSHLPSSTRGNLLGELFRFCAESHRRLGYGRGVFMHDVLAVAFWLGRIEADVESAAVREITAEGDSRGRIVHADSVDEGIEVNYALSLDHEALLDCWHQVIRGLS